jgi:hypothetical protein
MSSDPNKDIQDKDGVQMFTVRDENNWSNSVYAAKHVPNTIPKTSWHTVVQIKRSDQRSYQ